MFTILQTEQKMSNRTTKKDKIVKNFECSKSFVLKSDKQVNEFKNLFTIVSILQKIFLNH